MVVAAQLVEWSSLTPEIHDSNPVIGNFYFEKDSIVKEKEDVNGPSKMNEVVRAS